jgi:hypothetical protein
MNWFSEEEAMKLINNNVLPSFSLREEAFFTQAIKECTCGFILCILIIATHLAEFIKNWLSFLRCVNTYITTFFLSSGPTDF